MTMRKPKTAGKAHVWRDVTTGSSCHRWDGRVLSAITFPSQEAQCKGSSFP